MDGLCDNIQRLGKPQRNIENVSDLIVISNGGEEVTEVAINLQLFDVQYGLQGVYGNIQRQDAYIAKAKIL
jgi:hypothetical protein